MIEAHFGGNCASTDKIIIPDKRLEKEIYVAVISHDIFCGFFFPEFSNICDTSVSVLD